MEAGSAIRARAAAVRRKAARALGARRRLDDLVAAALAQASLTTEPFDFGDEGRAAGTRATLTPDRVILTSTDLNEADKRLAIVHELGHHHLHDDERLADGFGLRPVVKEGCVFADGYSYRSVKEVQADLFAWEFLCPSRELLPRLKGGAAPVQLAADLGLPEDLVRGQAINALLRTSKSAESRPRTRFRHLDPEQRACVTARDLSTLVVGDPGTGKTTILLERARHALRAGRPSGILFIAGTRIAAERHHAALSAERPKLAGHAFFGTFEDLAHEIVVRWPHRVERTEDFQMLDRVAALDAYRAAVALGRLGDGKPGSLRVLDGARLGATAPADGASELASAFDDDLARRDQVDGGGLIRLAIEVLSDHPDARLSLGRRFENILIDDLQDAPVAAVELLRMFAEHARVLAVADPTQAIDGFRNRSGSAVTAFSSAFTPFVRRLRQNQRASAPLDGVACGLQSRPGNLIPATHPTLTLEAHADRLSEVDAVARRVIELRRQNVAYRQQAIVTWSNNDLAPMAEALRREGVPTVYLGELRMRPEINDVLAFVRFAIEPTNANFAAVASIAPHPIRPADVSAVLEEATGRGSSAFEFLSSHARPARVDEAAWGRLTRLASHCALVGEGPLTARLVDWLFAPDSPLAPFIRDPRSSDARMALVAIHHLLNICRDHEVMGGGDFSGLERRVRFARSLNQRTRFHEVSTMMHDVDAVELLTIRASRGREFEAVHAFCLYAKPQRAGRSKDANEQRAHLTVALTRARRRLHATWPVKVDDRHADPLELLLALFRPMPRLSAQGPLREAATRRR